MSELNGGIPVDVNPNIEIDAPIEAEPTITLQAEVETEPTIELQARVEMGGRSSEYNAEAWAVGERGGVPVSSTDQTYHNNAKYYAEKSAEAASEAARAELNKKADVINITDDTQETVKTFDNGADQLPMALTVGIEPVQSGSGDPSPTNVRPISGWTGCNITRTGKNLLDYAQTPYSANSNINSSGEIGSNNNYDVYKLVLPAGSYFASEITTATANNQSIRIATYTKTGGMIDYYEQSRNGAGVMAKAFSVGDTAAYALVMIRKNCQNPYVVIGENETEYEPYAGEEYAIAFPSGAGTVYGGTLTVNKDGTGTLIVDMAEKDMGTIEWTKTGDRFYYNGQLSPKALNKSTWDVNEPMAVCSAYKYGNISPSNGVDKAIGFNSGKIYARDSAYSDAQNFASAVTGVKVVYKLNSPVTYQLSELEVIETLKGINNIFADTGDILSVDYSADTKMYVDAGESKQEQIDLTRDMIANTEPDDSTKAYYAGGIIIHDGALYEATEAISVGETLIENQNIKKTSIADLFGSNYYDVTLKQITIDGTSTYQSARIFKIGRMRMVNAMLSPMFFSTGTFMGDEPPTASELNFPVHYIHTENSQTVTEPCTLKYTKSTSEWELIRSDGTTMTLGSNTGITATDKIHFYGIWFV